MQTDNMFKHNASKTPTFDLCQWSIDTLRDGEKVYSEYHDKIT